MNTMIGDVRNFMQAAGQDIPAKIQHDLPEATRELRRRLIVEEAREVEDAIEANNLEEIADGLADLIYVAVGTALAYGIPLDRVWTEVQRSNMAKFPHCTQCAGHFRLGHTYKTQGGDEVTVLKCFNEHRPVVMGSDTVARWRPGAMGEIRAVHTGYHRVYESPPGCWQLVIKPWRTDPPTQEVEGAPVGVERASRVQPVTETFPSKEAAIARSLELEPPHHVHRYGDERVGRCTGSDFDGGDPLNLIPPDPPHPPCEACGGRGRVVLRDAGGKVVKPPGWTPPDIAAVLAGVK